MFDAGGRSGPDKEGFAILSSMHKKVLVLSLLGASAASAAAVATSYRPASLAAIVPTAAQSAPKIVRTAPQPSAAAAAAVQALPPVSGAISSSIARWNSLRQSDNHPFAAYASFLASHRGWPGETAMRRTA